MPVSLKLKPSAIRLSGLAVLTFIWYYGVKNHIQVKNSEMIKNSNSKILVYASFFKADNHVPYDCQD